MNIDRIFDGVINSNDYERWICQFEKNDIPYIEILVNNIKYFSLRRTEENILNLYNLILDYTKNIENVLFIPVGYVVKSGSVVAYSFRKINHIPEKKFIPYSELNKKNLSNVRYLVLLDDFIGTGHQCCEVWRDLDSKLKELDINPDLIYATSVSTQNGIKEVEEKTSFHVITSFLYENKEMPFHPDSHIIPDEEERDKIKSIVTKYGENLYPKYPLGYKNNSLLIGFYYSTPNNTLPIFWSSQNNWKPLLTKGDDFRDPQFLVGPEINIPKNLMFKGFERTFVDDNLLDNFNVDANILIKLTNELKNTQLLLIIVPVIQKLGLSEDFVTKLITLINALKSETHEQKNVTSAIFIFDEKEINKLDFYISCKNTNINDLDCLIDLANQCNGFEDCIAIDTRGNVLGNFIYEKNEEYINYIPSILQQATAFSSKNEGLLIVFEGENEINIIWRGQRLISHRKSSWYFTPSIFGKLNSHLAKMHGIKKESIDRILSIAVEMAHVGEGGLLTIGDADEVIKISVGKPNKNILLVNKNVLDFGIKQWIHLLSQDGASIFDNDGILIEYMATLRPSNDVEIELETGKGTKHQTAQIISFITNSITIAISVDSNFTIYSKGKKIFRMNG